MMRRASFIAVLGIASLAACGGGDDVDCSFAACGGDPGDPITTIVATRQ